jgi:hypothetical protein
LNEINENLWEEMKSMDNLDIFSENEKNIAYSAMADCDASDDVQSLANFCLAKLHSKHLREKMDKLNKKIS